MIYNSKYNYSAIALTFENVINTHSNSSSLIKFVSRVMPRYSESDNRDNHLILCPPQVAVLSDWPINCSFKLSPLQSKYNNHIISLGTMVRKPASSSFNAF